MACTRWTISGSSFCGPKTVASILPVCPGLRAGASRFLILGSARPQKGCRAPIRSGITRFPRGGALPRSPGGLSLPTFSARIFQLFQRANWSLGSSCKCILRPYRYGSPLPKRQRAGALLQELFAGLWVPAGWKESRAFAEITFMPLRTARGHSGAPDCAEEEGNQAAPKRDSVPEMSFIRPRYGYFAANKFVKSPDDGVQQQRL